MEYMLLYSYGVHGVHGVHGGSWSMEEFRYEEKTQEKGKNIKGVSKVKAATKQQQLW